MSESNKYSMEDELNAASPADLYEDDPIMEEISEIKLEELIQ